MSTSWISPSSTSSPLADFVASFDSFNSLCSDSAAERAALDACIAEAERVEAVDIITAVKGESMQCHRRGWCVNAMARQGGVAKQEIERALRFSRLSEVILREEIDAECALSREE